MTFIQKFLQSENIIYVGEFKKKENNVNLIDFTWSITNEIKKDRRGRVYFFIELDSEQNSKLIKIGKSSDKNGLGGTIGFYINTLSGTPSITRFCVHHLIGNKLDEGKRILVYCKFSESVKKEIVAFFEKKTLEIPLDITYIEEFCLEEYYEHFSEYPEWNFQEGGKQIPLNLIESYTIFIDNKRKKRIQ